MTKKYYESKSFKKAQNEWYLELQEVGFDDIEKTETETIIRPQEFYINSKFAFTEDHFQLCQRILDNYQFRDTVLGEIDRSIMELHAQGLSVRDIADHIEKNFYKKIKKSRVDEIIKKIKEDFLVNY